jgi:hypothetical protein
MTQALNLANFANNLNTSGATTNAGLQNSSVTVTAGTGMSGGGAVSLGSSVTLTNAGVTSLTAGSGISVSASTGSVTITASGGGVTSAVAGSGIAVSASTGAVTFSTAAPSFNAVGSYCQGQRNTTNTTSGSDYAAGSGASQIQSQELSYGTQVNNLSGTWRYMGATQPNSSAAAIYVRVS